MICLIKRRLPSPKFPEDAGLKILGVPTPDACGFYRIIQPCTELCEEYPDMFVSAKFLNLNEQDVGLSSVSDADIIFIQRGAPNNPSKVLQILHLARSLGKMIIYDLDDYWAVPKWNPAYRLWTQTNLEYYIKQVLRDSTVITCTTNKFKEEIEKYTDKPTYIVRNAISRKHKNWSLEKKESSLVRIGWVGGIHHMRDVEVVRGIGKWLIEKFENVSLTLVGYKKDGNKLKEKVVGKTREAELVPTPLPKKSIMHERYAKVLFDEDNIGFTPLEYSTDRVHLVEGAIPTKYGKFFADFDIVIAFLENNIFNTMKSEIKIAEAIIYKSAFISTDIKPYNEWIRNEENGYLCNTIKEWKNALRRLIKDKEHRLKVAENLSSEYREMFDMKNQAKTLKDIIEDNYDSRYQFEITKSPKMEN